MGARRFSGPITHPSFHPVIENTLPAEPIEMVRSNIPGRDAARVCFFQNIFHDENFNGNKTHRI